MTAALAVPLKLPLVASVEEVVTTIAGSCAIVTLEDEALQEFASVINTEYVPPANPVAVEVV